MNEREQLIQALKTCDESLCGECEYDQERREKCRDYVWCMGKLIKRSMDELQKISE